MTQIESSNATVFLEALHEKKEIRHLTGCLIPLDYNPETKYESLLKVEDLEELISLAFRRVEDLIIYLSQKGIKVFDLMPVQQSELSEDGILRSARSFKPTEIFIGALDVIVIDGLLYPLQAFLFQFEEGFNIESLLEQPEVTISTEVKFNVEDLPVIETPGPVEVDGEFTEVVEETQEVQQSEEIKSEETYHEQESTPKQEAVVE